MTSPRILVPLLLAITLAAVPLVGQVDLAVASVDASGLTWDAQALTVSGVVAADVDNLGAAPSGPFTAVFFEDLDVDGAFGPLTDRVLATIAATSLAGGATTTLSAPIADDALFAGNVVRLVLDPGGLIAETDETNNLGHSGEDCVYVPTPGSITPQIEWSWTTATTLPTSVNVMMTPAVMDLDGDGTPEVIFGSTASTSGGLVEVGNLRALRGSDGVELFTVTSHLVNTACSVAVGDIDLDGSPEIIACASSNTRLLAFEHDGTFKWQSDIVEPVNWGGPSIADLDGDGTPEIITGRQVLSAAGTLLWTGTGGAGNTGAGALSFVADVDLDGVPEVVAGNTVYTASGAILWQAPVADGVGAIGNFDADPFPEIVHVAGGQVRLYQHDGTLAWGPVAIPAGGTGGPPTVADYDGDGLPEIGVAGAARYAVFEHDGVLKWQSVTQDASSNRTGSSVFDFDGDGAAEVVYRDELFLRIYAGVDGTILFQTALSSCTWHEYVLVADVDADGNAEIVAVANTSCGIGPQQGVRVYGDANDDWVATRTVWNQHSYHITNVNDDGSIPQFESANWLFPAADPYNNFRQNVLTTAGVLAAPDLTASYIRFGCTAMPQVTARIGNAGAVQVGAGIPVSFYDGDPSAGGVLLGTVATSVRLAPGRFEDVTLALPPAFFTLGSLHAVADDSGGLVSTENECDETNNEHARLFEVCTSQAAAIVYGTGWPGTLGIPALGTSAPPVLGTTIDLLLGNARGTPTFVCLLVGFAPLSLPTVIGGTALVDPTLEPVIAIDVGTHPLPIAIPCDVDLCGVSLFFQGIQLDYGASHGYAFSPGLELILGE